MLEKARVLWFNKVILRDTDMNSFQEMRKNMVDGQIHPSGVIDPRILENFELVPREQFVPSKMMGVAYQDEDLVLPDGRFLLDPTVHARMIQALNLKTEDVVLDIGCACGYSSAVICNMVTTVIAVEQTQKYLDMAQDVWDGIEASNIAAFKGMLKKGYPDEAPYDAIILNGATAETPAHLVPQLIEGGQMVFIDRPAGSVVGQAVLLKHTGGGEFSQRPLFDAITPYLKGFEPVETFAF